jgi:lysophospholipid acyltransferase
MIEFSRDPSNSHLPAVLGDWIASQSASLGFAADQIRLMICLLAALPLGALHKLLPGATIKHIYSFLIGLWYTYFVVGFDTGHVFLFSLMIYVLARVLPRRQVAGFIFFLSLSYLSYSHIHRMITDYGGYSLDVTLVQMVLVVKFATFAYNWADGQAINKGEKLSDKPHIHEDRANRAIQRFPSLIEYLSYIWCYSGVLVGPCFEIRSYLEFTDLSLFKKHGIKSVPSTFIPSAQAIFRALFVYGGVFLTSIFPIQGFIDTDEYYEKPFLYRFSFMFVATMAARCKYYFVWYLAEAGCISSGLSFNGVQETDKQPLWDRIRNVYHFKVELAHSMPQFTNNWNLGVNNWLKNYVYLRVERPKFLSFVSSKMYANIITKLTSAFWHGFYPSYYLFFLGAVFVNEMDDALKTNIEPYFHKKDSKSGKNVPNYPIKYVYDVLAWVLLLGHMNYLGTIFLLLEVEKSLRFFKSFYYFIFWVPIIIIFITKLIRHPSTKQKKSAPTSFPNGKPELIAGSGALTQSAQKKSKEEETQPEPRKTRSKKAD